MSVILMQLAFFHGPLGFSASSVWTPATPVCYIEAPDGSPLDKCVLVFSSILLSRSIRFVSQFSVLPVPTVRVLLLLSLVHFSSVLGYVPEEDWWGQRFGASSASREVSGWFFSVTRPRAA